MCGLLISKRLSSVQDSTLSLRNEACGNIFCCGFCVYRWLKWCLPRTVPSTLAFQVFFEIISHSRTNDSGSEPRISAWRSAKHLQARIRTTGPGWFGTSIICLAGRQADKLGSEPPGPGGSEPALSAWRSAKQINLVPSHTLPRRATNLLG